MMTSQHNLNHVEPAKGETLCAGGTGRAALHPFTGLADQGRSYQAGILIVPLDTERAIGRAMGWLGHDTASVVLGKHPSA